MSQRRQGKGSDHYNHIISTQHLCELSHYLHGATYITLCLLSKHNLIFDV